MEHKARNKEKFKNRLRIKKSKNKGKRNRARKAGKKRRTEWTKFQKSEIFRGKMSALPWVTVKQKGVIHLKCLEFFWLEYGNWIFPVHCFASPTTSNHCSGKLSSIQQCITFDPSSTPDGPDGSLTDGPKWGTSPEFVNFLSSKIIHFSECATETQASKPQWLDWWTFEH